MHHNHVRKHEFPEIKQNLEDENAKYQEGRVKVDVLLIDKDRSCFVIELFKYTILVRHCNILW